MQRIIPVPYREMEEIGLDELVSDRQLQKRIYYTYMNSTTDINEAIFSTEFYNPNPTIKLKGDYEIDNYPTFKISDNKHLYLFMPGLNLPEKYEDINKAPEYLKQEDLIPLEFVFFKKHEYQTVKELFGSKGFDLMNILNSGQAFTHQMHGTEPVPFRKSLKRINSKGGSLERYNSRKAEWELDKDYNLSYKPSIFDRFLNLF